MRQRDGLCFRGDSPIRQSVKAKSTSSRVAEEWREASTRDAGWTEGDMEEEEWMAVGRELCREEAWSYIRQTRMTLTSQRVRIARCAAGRHPWQQKVSDSCRGAQVIRSPSLFGKSLNCNLPLSRAPYFISSHGCRREAINPILAQWRLAIRKSRCPVCRIRNLSILAQPHPLPCCEEGGRRPHLLRLHGW